MDFEALGAWFSWILVPLDDVFWFPRPVSRDMRGACQVADLTLMIRATRGRSRRPNHMRSPLDALQTPGPVNLRRLLGKLHSVAKQASFSIAFRRDFGGFSSDFGRVWEAKMEVEIDFSVIFFDVFPNAIWHRFLLDFWRLETLKITVFRKENLYFPLNQRYRKSSEKSSILACILKA